MAAIPPQRRTDLANRLLLLLDRKLALWRTRNRPGGVRDALKRLLHLLRVLTEGLPSYASVLEAEGRLETDLAVA